MKKPKTTLSSLILILTLSSSLIAQTSASSTPQKPTSAPDSASAAAAAADLKAETKTLRLERAQRTIARLIADIKAARKYTAAQDAEIKELEDRLQWELANSESLDRSLKLALVEIGRLRAALEFAAAQRTADQETIGLVTKQRDQERRRNETLRNRAIVGGAIGVAIAVAVKIFF